MATIDNLVALAESAASGTDAHLIDSKFHSNLAQMAAAEQAETLRQLVTCLAEQKRSSIQALKYPDDVKQLIHKEFDKISLIASDAPDDQFAMSNYRLRSRLRILCFGRVPVGPEHLEVDGVPRHLLYRGGPQQAFRFAKLLATIRTLRPQPFYVLHLGFLEPGAFLLQYSAREQRKMFKRLAGCLELNPEILGVSASAWWYDPAIAAHSDYLSYLREGWETKGGQFFAYETSEQDKRLATTGSETRQKLFDEGKYHPKSFLVAWTRDSIMRWAQSESR